ncbi:MAG: hypothetical protein AB8G05_06070 [Oligoflexales bacterium]
MLRQFIFCIVIMVSLPLTTLSHAEVSDQFIQVSDLDELENLRKFGHQSVSTEDMIPLAIAPELGLEMLAYGYEKKHQSWIDHKENLLCNMLLFSLVGGIFGRHKIMTYGYSEGQALLLGVASGAVSGGGYYALSRIALGGLELAKSVVRLPGDVFSWGNKARKFYKSSFKVKRFPAS